MSTQGISVIWAGDWSSNKTYRRNQAVYYNGSSYRAIRTTAQTPSPTATDWDLLALGTLEVGEVNTASNLGSGVGVFNQKVNADLQFKSLTPGSNKVSIVNDSISPEIDIDINEGNLTLNNLAGNLSISKGGTNATTASQALTNLGAASISNLTSHTTNTSNPHSVTASQVGNTVAQWNANQIQGVTVNDSGKANGKVLKFNSTTNSLEYADDLTSSGGGGASTLNDLTDVTITSPTNGQALVYNSSTSEWVNQTISGGGGGGGKVVQFLYSYILPTWNLSTYNTWQNTDLSLTVTPTNASSTIHISGVLRIFKTSTANTNYFDLRIVEGANIYSQGTNIGRRSDSQYIEPISLMLTVPASSINSRTYTLQINQRGSGYSVQPTIEAALNLMEILP